MGHKFCVHTVMPFSLKISWNFNIFTRRTAKIISVIGEEMNIGPTGDFSMVIVIMGVSGCGKTTVGRRVAEVLRVPFLDADDFHPAANIRKMKRSLPLADDDRRPWLKTVAEKMAEMAGQGGGVVACSALKESYRHILFGDSSIPILLVYLKGTRGTLYRRLQHRKSHFMPSDLLDSQLSILEEPEHALTLSIELSPEILCERIVHHAVGS